MVQMSEQEKVLIVTLSFHTLLMIPITQALERAEANIKMRGILYKCDDQLRYMLKTNPICNCASMMTLKNRLRL
jgi:hypothetical protein